MHRLTDIEREVLALLCGGASYQEIAARRNRAIGTVRNETQEIYRKLNVHSAREACAIFGRSGGLVEPGVPAPDIEGARANQV